MALFNKLFFSSSKRKNFTTNQQEEYLSQFPFDENQVRILLYRECDTRGRRLLFDSSALMKYNISTGQNGTSSAVPKVNTIRTKSTATETGNTATNGKKCPNGGFIEISDGYGYKHSRPNSPDVASIGEMVFGALAMSFRGTALKVHWLQSPARVLCSQVFLSPIHASTISNRTSTTNLSLGQPSDLGITDSASVSSFSMPFSVSVNENLGDKNLTTNPLDVPAGSDLQTESSHMYSTYSGCDSGYSGTDAWTTSNSSCQYSTRSSLGSVFGDQESFRKFSVDSSFLVNDGRSRVHQKNIDGSFRRRISRNLYTSFENHNSLSDFIGFVGDNYQTATSGGSDSCVQRGRYPAHTVETRSNPEMMRKRGASGDTFHNSTSHTRHQGKRAKLGLAVCITLSETFEKEMELFCSEHIALLESMLCRLRASAENAYINHKNFLQIMFRAWKTTTKWIKDLFTAPRIPCPVWLTMNNGSSQNSKNIADSFMSELCWLLTSADTKDTNFFISTMLTAVLTHHLGWVSTVAAFNLKSKSQMAEVVSETNAKLKEISRRHPYNALWAQMGDLYGAIGNPAKISRTIIYGSERQTVNKVLNVLTYFIRCGEVRRVMGTEIFNKEIISKMLTEASSKSDKSIEKKSKSPGLRRTQTSMKNLNESSNNTEQVTPKGDFDSDFNRPAMNDIPNVLVFRDSRFVQQELRIGNILMDTGIEMNSKQKQDLKIYQPKEKIRVMVTSPDNIETQMGSQSLSNSSVDIVDGTGAMEAIEIDPNTKVEEKQSNNFFWSIEPVKEGLSWDEIEKLQKGNRISNQMSDEEMLGLERSILDRDEINSTAPLKRCSSLSLSTKSDNQRSMAVKMCGDHVVAESAATKWSEVNGNKNKKSHTSLSDLITANSVGLSERFIWGVERVKETVSLEEEQHFELSKKIIMEDKQRMTCLEKDKGVVFLLGENEALVNIRKSNEDLPKLNDEETKTRKPHTCNHKKHSVVKFNFEQYPQIATNYMKNKNIDLTNYGFLEKSSKLDGLLNYGPSTSAFPVGFSKGGEISEVCRYCASGIGTRILQTPSNATELEFTSDDNYPPVSVASCSTIPSNLGTGKNINFMPRIETIVEENKISTARTSSTDDNIDIALPALSLEKEKPPIHLIEIPMPETKSNNGKTTDSQIKPGFIPSLLVGISDHYIPDMVLQGTCASPQTWEMNLKQDLALAAHCATLIPAPTENVAVVADLDKWDVKIVSSQTHILPHGSGTGGPVGMSQLVSTMLETVHTMCNSGISAFECLSYLESKLQEMYLQSEALAAFLLATEFCSLSTVTSALNLSANDVPLLLSVASIHSPQVTKKYGVSSR